MQNINSQNSKRKLAVDSFSSFGPGRWEGSRALIWSAAWSGVVEEFSGRYVVSREKNACSVLDGSWGDSRSRLRGFEAIMILRAVIMEKRVCLKKREYQ